MNNIHYNVWDEIMYPFQNFNGYTIEIGIIKPSPHYIIDVITYPWY